MHKALEDFLLEVGAGGPIEIIPSTLIKDPYGEPKFLALAKPLMVPAHSHSGFFGQHLGWIRRQVSR